MCIYSKILKQDIDNSSSFINTWLSCSGLFFWCYIHCNYKFKLDCVKGTITVCHKKENLNPCPFLYKLLDI